MKRKFLCLLVLVFVTCAIYPSGAMIATSTNPFQASADTASYGAGNTVIIDHELAPINRDAYLDLFIQTGKLPANPTQEQIKAAFDREFGNIRTKAQPSKGEKMRLARAEAAVRSNKGTDAPSTQAGKSSQSDQDSKNAKPTQLLKNSSKTQILSPVQSLDSHEPVREVKVLVLLIEYPDLENNDEPRLSPRSYYTEDFSPEHYEKMLFGEELYTTTDIIKDGVVQKGIESETMTTYFRSQSNGYLHVTGDVYGWYRAGHDAKYYGADRDDVSGDDTAPRQLVVEALLAAAADPSVDFSEYDLFNNETMEPEPDGLIDHLMIIHAGIGQEEGGGSLKTDAIWSHSWDLDVTCQEQLVDFEVKAANYTIQPENGSVGVFAHEFTHDLGLPDDYDTLYSGDGDIVEAWSIMASGSWTGEVGGTRPVGINPWGRALLSWLTSSEDIVSPWIQYEVVTAAGSVGTHRFTTASYQSDDLQALIVLLPDYSRRVLTPAAGSHVYWAGKGSEINHTLDIPLDATEVVGSDAASFTLDYDIWYDIEEDWDAGFIQISTDGGTSFRSLQTPLTKAFVNPDGYPAILDSLPAYTGNSGGWRHESIDLLAYAGQEVVLRFRYATDWGTELAGMYLDNLKVTMNNVTVLSDGAENGFPSADSDGDPTIVYMNAGWTQDTGNPTHQHRYVMEWRSHLGVDQGLTKVGGANFSYNRGFVNWYVNDAYDDNWVGFHPGFGRIGVVDATQHVYLNQGLGNGNEYDSRAGFMPFVQMKDAAFSTDRSPDTDLSYYTWAGTSLLKGKAGVSLFRDTDSWIDVKNPYGGLFLPGYGLQAKVLGEADDYSCGLVQITIGK